MRKVSEGTPRKVSDIVSRRLSDADSHSNTLTFRDVMLSMIQPSSESVSDVESNSDEDEYLIVHKSNISLNPPCTDEDNDDDDDKSESEDTPPQPPPRRSKGNSARRSFENSLDLDTSLPYGQQYRVTMETNDQPTDIPTAEVDGVDIDTIGNTAQEVSSIDQGEDMVILDLKGETKETVSESSAEQSPEGKNSETNIEEVSDIEDEKMQSTDTADSATDTPPKAAEVSFDDLRGRLSHMEEYLPEHSEIESDGLNQPTNALNDEADDVEDIEKDDDDEVSCGTQGGGAVSLTRVKCVVSMTTPRDARAHGATDCPSFVEFDMSVDGFGCLFLPAIAPQVYTGELLLVLLGRENKFLWPGTKHSCQDLKDRHCHL